MQNYNYAKLKSLNNLFDKLVTYKIPLQELVSLYFNLRPLVRIGCSYNQLEIFKELCLILGFKFLIIESCGPSKDNPLFLISKSEKKLYTYYKLEKKKDETLLLGEYLGYPACCVNKYAKNIRITNKNGPMRTLSNTNGGLCFFLNFLYNFESRNFNYDKFMRFSSDYNLNNIYLIPHIPCSYNCQISINYSLKLANLLKLYFPNYYKRLVFFLKRPILYFSDFIFFPFIGKVYNNSLTYNGFIKISNILPTYLIELLRKGNFIKENNNRFQIFKGNRFIGVLPFGFELFNFE